MLENKGLKELVWYLKLKYIMPLRATVTKCIANAKTLTVEGKKDELNLKLARADKLALTMTDGQFSQTKVTLQPPGTSSMLTGRMQSSVLLTRRLSIRHMSEHLAERRTKMKASLYFTSFCIFS